VASSARSVVTGGRRVGALRAAIAVAFEGRAGLNWQYDLHRRLKLQARSASVSLSELIRQIRNRSRSLILRAEELE